MCEFVDWKSKEKCKDDWEDELVSALGDIIFDLDISLPEGFAIAGIAVAQTELVEGAYLPTVHYANRLRPS